MCMQARTVFVGESPLNDMTAFSGGHGPRFRGNTILVQPEDADAVRDLEDNFIAQEIFRFRALAPIVSFVSPVGNSDVPYAYAVDRDGVVYLLNADVVLLNASTLAPFLHGPSDPYSYYYDAALITPITVASLPAARYSRLSRNQGILYRRRRLHHAVRRRCGQQV